MDNNFLILLLFLLVKCEDILYNHTNEDNNLYFVFTTFRHGARTTFSSRDVFGNNITYLGKLTKYGELQHLEIGKNYRKRYSNFLNMNFDQKEMHIRSSDVERTIISTEKQLEGLFQKSIDRQYFDIVNGGIDAHNLFHLNKKEHKKMDKYMNSCRKRVLGPNYLEIYKTEIFPILKNCFNKTEIPEIYGFCDSTITAYFEYTYENNVNNQIGKCGTEYAVKMNDFCYEWYNSFRGWDEYNAYMFYYLFQHLFDYMNKAIKGKSPFKMFMVGGHDVTVDKFMNFLDGMKIIPRTHYPHYACNIVIELRKYNKEFYLEFYYNDILKYNNTLDTFKNILQNSNYSNLYNYCGSPVKNYLKKIFGQEEDKNVYIITISIIIIVVVIIAIIVAFSFIWKRKKKFIRLTEEKSQKSNQVSVLGITDPNQLKKDEKVEKDEKDKKIENK